MTLRRDFCRSVAGAAGVALLPGAAPLAASPPVIAPLSAGRPLFELQQEFLDLRFGMFLHFNMATFQVRKWGDPTAALIGSHPQAWIPISEPPWPDRRT